MNHLQEYDEWLEHNRDFVAGVRDLVIEELDDAGLAYDQVTVRIKDRESFAQKVASEKFPEYVDVASAHDLVGIRVITFHSSHIPRIMEVISDLFEVVKIIDKAAETAQAGRFGYSSQHLIVRKDKQLVEIQLRTVLQHAWAEFEHDIRYKNPGQSDPQIARAFTLAAGLIELADQQFDTIANIVENNTDEADEQLEPTHLPTLIRRLVGDDYPTSHSGYYIYAIRMLETHGITRVKELAELLSPGNIDKLCNAMGYKFRPGQVRLIDDMLLFHFGREHIKKTVHIGASTASRPGRLGARWQQLGQQTIDAL